MSTKTSGHRAFTWTLGTCTAVSLAGNVAAATLLPHQLALPTPVVIVAASVAPLLLPAAVHLVPRTDDLPRRVRAVVVLAVAISAAAAFVLSFASLTAVAQASGHAGRHGMLLPVAVDVLAAAAAYALVVMPTDAGEVAEPAADRDANPVTHAVHRGADLSYPVGLTWMTQPATQPIDYGTELTSPASTSGDSMTQAGDATADAVPAPRRRGPTRPDAAPATPVGDAADAAEAGPRRTLVTQLGDAADRDAEILRRAEAGESSREIAGALGISPSTAQRVIRRAA